MGQRDSAIIAAVIILAGTILAAVVTGILSRPSSNPDPTPPAEEPLDYQQYVPLRDDTGTLTVSVPVEWRDHRGNGWHPPTSPDTRVGSARE